MQPVGTLTREEVILKRMRLVCKARGHKFEVVGGRSCPKGIRGYSQEVLQCKRCGDYDYGEATCCKDCNEPEEGYENED